MSFNDLGLSPLLVKALATKGYTTPSPVQTQAIPAALTGADLLVSAQTGSGKTAAFILPSLQRLDAAPVGAGNGPRILVLAPTRELALQVEKAAIAYGNELRRLRCVAIVGGSSYQMQFKALSRPVDVLVATPGRLIDHLERGRIDLARVQTLVLDEADRMLDMGFIEDIEAIVARTPKARQTLLFSATLEGVVGRLASRVTRDAQRIVVTSAPAEQLRIVERLHFADDLGHKNRLLDTLLRDADIKQALVFTATKRTADSICETLREQGFAAEALHGDMTQGSRNRTLMMLRQGRIRVLVATDVAARGIDVPGISHVINFDLPNQGEDYVHRIGRTGRAGRDGIAVSLAGHDERFRVRAIERYTRRGIPVEVIAGLEPKGGFRREGPPRGGRPGGFAKPGGPGRFNNRDAGGDRSERRGPGGSRADGFGGGPRRGQGGVRPAGAGRGGWR